VTDLSSAAPAASALDEQLLGELRRCRRDGGTTPYRELDFETGRRYLRELVAEELGRGDEVRGWKVAHLPPGAPEFSLAAPVLSSAVDRLPVAPATARVEVELVGRVRATTPSGRPTELEWHLGLEVIGNHADDGRVSYGWACADWGLNVAAAVGGTVGAHPAPGEPIEILLSIGDEDAIGITGRALDPDVAFAALERDCAATVRPCHAGDLVWIGSLITPVALSGHTAITASALGADVTLSTVCGR
jgi:hypothetical protein